MQLCFVTSNWGICVGVRGRILMRVQGIPHKQDCPIGCEINDKSDLLEFDIWLIIV